jgi:hypothetical protein
MFPLVCVYVNQTLSLRVTLCSVGLPFGLDFVLMYKNFIGDFAKIVQVRKEFCGRIKLRNTGINCDVSVLICETPQILGLQCFQNEFFFCHGILMLTQYFRAYLQQWVLS